MQKVRHTQESTITKSFITSKQNVHSKSNLQTDAHHESQTCTCPSFPSGQNWQKGDREKNLLSSSKQKLTIKLLMQTDLAFQRKNKL